jgi:hypothetical protein
MSSHSTPMASDLARSTLASRRRFALALGGVLLAPLARAQSGSERLRETLVKAALLHKFSSFVEWPAGAFTKADSPLRIGVLGDDQLLQDLRELAQDQARDGRPVLASRVTDMEGLGNYHILYLRAISAARLSELLQQVPEAVLTVADSDGIHPRGSVLSFFVDEGRVRFGASLEAAARQKLRLNSRLLSVAKLVSGEPGSAPSRA